MNRKQFKTPCKIPPTRVAVYGRYDFDDKELLNKTLVRSTFWFANVSIIVSMGQRVMFDKEDGTGVALFAENWCMLRWYPLIRVHIVNRKKSDEEMLSLSDRVIVFIPEDGDEDCERFASEARSRKIKTKVVRYGS